MRYVRAQIVLTRQFDQFQLGNYLQHGVARSAFARLQPLWKTFKYSSKTKLCIFKTNVVAILLYGAEISRITAADMNNLDAFHRKCLREIQIVFWPNQISNEELYRLIKSCHCRWRYHYGRDGDGSDMSCRDTAITLPELHWPGYQKADHQLPGGGVSKESEMRWDGSHGEPW